MLKKTTDRFVNLVIVPTEGTMPTRLRTDLMAVAPKVVDHGVIIHVQRTVTASCDMPPMSSAAPRLLLVQATSFGSAEAMRLLNQGGEATFVAAQIDGIYPQIPFGTRRCFKAIQKRQPVSYIPADVRRRNDWTNPGSKKYLSALKSLLILAVEGQEIAQAHWANINTSASADTDTQSLNGKVRKHVSS